jgi:hypothetical protein
MLAAGMLGACWLRTIAFTLAGLATTTMRTSGLACAASAWAMDA